MRPLPKYYANFDGKSEDCYYGLNGRLPSGRIIVGVLLVPLVVVLDVLFVVELFTVVFSVTGYI